MPQTKNSRSNYSATVPTLGRYLRCDENLKRDSQADATGGISVALSVCPRAQAELATVLVFPVITAGGRGLGVDGRNRSAAPRPVLPVHGEINRKQFEWRNKFSVALPAVNWLRVAAPRRRRNLCMEAPSCSLPTHAPAASQQLGVFMSEKSVETYARRGLRDAGCSYRPAALPPAWLSFRARVAQSASAATRLRHSLDSQFGHHHADRARSGLGDAVLLPLMPRSRFACRSLLLNLRAPAGRRGEGYRPAPIFKLHLTSIT
ncbi:unnamed protein product [Chrysodeixis includens]|uniref:Uncharacterized protein n=1 Tax=Chrysodeixis includens TaxID=689277 RepID=A0A9N8PXJ4_CHRIL|nr:unnamed protein product [Chrysodeixis includens]